MSKESKLKPFQTWEGMDENTFRSLLELSVEDRTKKLINHLKLSKFKCETKIQIVSELCESILMNPSLQKLTNLKKWTLLLISVQFHKSCCS